MTRARLALLLCLAAGAAAADQATTIERTRAWPAELAGEWEWAEPRDPVRRLFSAVGCQSQEEVPPSGDVLVAAPRWGDLQPWRELVVVRVGGAVRRIMANPRQSDWWSRWTVDGDRLVEEIGKPTAGGDDLVADPKPIAGEILTRPR